MNVLLLAPHPFYQERGTPIAVHLLLETLSAKGVDVDLLTYHEGEDRTYNGPGRVRIFRISPPPACRNIRPGFSRKKLQADWGLYRGAKRLLRGNRYDLLHAVEESAFMARRLGRKHRIPFIYDMDSCLSRQILDKMPFLRPFGPLMRALERPLMRDASAVAAVCDDLAELARKEGAKKVVLLRDVPLLGLGSPETPVENLRKSLGIEGVLLLYVGNLESYQGVDLLVKAFARLPAEAEANLVVIGGVPSHVERLRRLCEKLGVAGRTHILGPRPLAALGAYCAQADVLVSPRTQGNNTPMKIYSYMAAGKPILATRLFTHTQVLEEHTAALAEPDAADFAEVMGRLIEDADLRERLGQAARESVETRYSLRVFQEAVATLYALR